MLYCVPFDVYLQVHEHKFLVRVLPWRKGKGSMKSIITNIRILKLHNPALRNTASQIAVESLGPLTWRVLKEDRFHVDIEFPSSRLNTLDENLKIHDGVIKDLEIKELPLGSVLLTINYLRPSTMKVTKSPGIPERCVIEVFHDSIEQVLKGRSLLIDPGHGGIDKGARGPVNLLEKDVVMHIAGCLQKLLRQSKALPVLARQGDYLVPAARKAKMARAYRAEAVISLHMGSSADHEVCGARTLYNPRAKGSKDLAAFIQRGLLNRLNIPDRGISETPAGFISGLEIPMCQVEVVTITNWVEEGLLRSPVFHERAAEGILCGLADYFSQTKSPPSYGRLEKIPLRTHIISEEDDLVQIILRYAGDIVRPGDIICIAESVAAITQGRAVLPKDVNPSLLARFLCRFPGKDGSLATPPAMQLAIQEVGVPRILLGTLAAGLGRVVGRKGDFYRVAGRSLALIDDIAGTMPPFDKHVVLGPVNSSEVVKKIKEAVKAHAVIADVNDKGFVDIIGSTAPVSDEVLAQVLSDNPFGNDDQKTPIVILRGLLSAT